MKALKVLVIGMGTLIVVGLGLLGYGLYRNTHRLSVPAASNAPAVTAPSAPVSAGAGRPAALAGPVGESYFSTELPVPAGSRFEQMTTAGDRIVLRFTGADGDRLLVVDPHNGQIAGTVTLLPERH